MTIKIIQTIGESSVTMENDRIVIKSPNIVIKQNPKG